MIYLVCYTILSSYVDLGCMEYMCNIQLSFSMALLIVFIVSYVIAQFQTPRINLFDWMFITLCTVEVKQNADCYQIGYQDLTGARGVCVFIANFS